MKSTPKVMSESPGVFTHCYRAHVNETLRRNSNWMPDSVLQHWEQHGSATREHDWFLLQRIFIFRICASNICRRWTDSRSSVRPRFLLAWLATKAHRLLCAILRNSADWLRASAVCGASRYRVEREQLRNSHIRMKSTC